MAKTFKQEAEKKALKLSLKLLSEGYTKEEATYEVMKQSGWGRQTCRKWVLDAARELEREDNLEAMVSDVEGGD